MSESEDIYIVHREYNDGMAVLFPCLYCYRTEEDALEVARKMKQEDIKQEYIFHIKRAPLYPSSSCPYDESSCFLYGHNEI